MSKIMSAVKRVTSLLIGIAAFVTINCYTEVFFTHSEALYPNESEYIY